MRVELGPTPADAERWLPENEPDASGVGGNHADAFLAVFKATLEDGRKVACRRRGLELTLTLGDRTGKALLRRREHGPDVRDILHAALAEAADEVGARFAVEDGIVVLELDPDRTAT